MKLYTADKIKELGSKDNFPPCECHGEPQYWAASKQGFRCRVKQAGYDYKKRNRGNGAYTNWRNMNIRCYDPNHNAYSRYHDELGIEVCERWRAKQFGGRDGAYQRFLEDMGPRPDDGRNTIDRIDPTENYEPGNVRWLSLEDNIRRAHTK